VPFCGLGQTNHGKVLLSLQEFAIIFEQINPIQRFSNPYQSHTMYCINTQDTAELV
jgi:hypothetical protein